MTAHSLPSARRHPPPLLLLALGLVLLAATAIAALAIGRAMLSPGEVIAVLARSLRGDGDVPLASRTIVMGVRLPRVAAAAMIGAALALLVSANRSGVQAAAFAGGVIAVLLTYASARSIGRGTNQVLLLVLCGMIVSALFQAFVSAVKYTADPDSKLPEITYWLMGSIAKVTWSDLALYAVPLVVGLIPIIALRWRLNTLAFGEEEAESLGVNVAALRVTCIVCATLLTASSVAISGVIGWVGLIMPHLVRFIAGPDNRIVVPLSVILGGAFLMLVDTACRTVTPSEIPLGILTSVIGAPLFFIILLRSQRGARS